MQHKKTACRFPYSVRRADSPWNEVDGSAKSEQYSRSLQPPRCNLGSELSMLAPPKTTIY
jgi:hypothetical protein